MAERYRPAPHPLTADLAGVLETARQDRAETFRRGGGALFRSAIGRLVGLVLPRRAVRTDSGSRAPLDFGDPIR